MENTKAFEISHKYRGLAGRASNRHIKHSCTKRQDIPNRREKYLYTTARQTHFQHIFLPDRLSTCGVVQSWYRKRYPGVIQNPANSTHRHVRSEACHGHPEQKRRRVEEDEISESFERVNHLRCGEHPVHKNVAGVRRRGKCLVGWVYI